MAQSGQQLITSLLQKEISSRELLSIEKRVVNELRKYDKDAMPFGGTIVYGGRGYRVKFTVTEY